MGTVISFYSYKGGVGRSAAVANVARLLTQDGGSPRNVLVIDWDLDAPGVHRYFKSIEIDGKEDTPGVLDVFERLSRSKRLADLDLDPYLIRNASPGVDFMTAGSGAAAFQEPYRRRLRAFDWARAYAKSPETFDLFRRTVSERYRYCLIDSRTGYSDIGSVCTAVLPDKLVGVFTPNAQNLHGIMNMLRIAVEFRRNSNDPRPLTVYPLPSRIETRAPVDQQVWLLSFRDRFEALLNEIYGIDGDLQKYFDTVQVPHDPYYAYGENVAVNDEERSQPGSCRQAYENLARYLVKDAPWKERPLKLRRRRVR